MKKKLIEHCCEDGIADTSRYKLTEEAKRNLLAELKINAAEEKLADVIKARDLTEKNIKALFDRYREQVKRAKLTPILLFNEADAIIGIRKQGVQSAVDKMETPFRSSSYRSWSYYCCQM